MALEKIGDLDYVRNSERSVSESLLYGSLTVTLSTDSLHSFRPVTSDSNMTGALSPAH